PRRAGVRRPRPAAGRPARRPATAPRPAAAPSPGGRPPPPAGGRPRGRAAPTAGPRPPAGTPRPAPPAPAPPPPPPPRSTPAPPPPPRPGPRPPRRPPRLARGARGVAVRPRRLDTRPRLGRPNQPQPLHRADGGEALPRRHHHAGRLQLRQQRARPPPHLRA